MTKKPDIVRGSPEWYKAIDDIAFKYIPLGILFAIVFGAVLVVLTVHFGWGSGH